MRLAEYAVYMKAMVNAQAIHYKILQDRDHSKGLGVDEGKHLKLNLKK
jgi:hypothetical protein